MSLTQEKVNQAIGILKEQNIDMWLTFVRETSGVRDPVLDFLIGDHDLTWHSALILTRTGEKIIILGNLEKDEMSRLNIFNQVIGYDISIIESLRETIIKLNPKQIAVNVSKNNVHADGLTHSMYETLLEYLADTPYTQKIISAEPVINAMRGRKTPTELERIKKAIQITEEIYQKTFEFIKIGMTEIEVADFMHKQMEEYGVGFAWPRENNPAVNSGPNSPVGHNGPTEIKIERGHVIHFDFGVKYEDYCSDIQRVAYVLRENETQAPPEVQRGFMTIRNAIEQSRQAMKAGVSGNSVDVISREVLTDSGYPEYPYALGHQLGRVAHDGGALLGPLWEKYGDSPNQSLEVDQVYTIEPGLALPQGYIGIEEDVVLTKNGAVYLGTPQTEIVLIRK
jgi:Xaa-Pro aminopeptidase